MTRVDEWWSEQPRRDPVEYALELARARVWRDERRFVRTVADVEDSAPLLELDAGFAHAFVLVLSQLPEAARRPFAQSFYAQRARTTTTERYDPLSVGAAVGLLILELTEQPDLQAPRIVDLLEGAAQGDDPALTPEPALAEIRKIVARIRLDLDLEDESAPHAAAAIAVAELLDPSSGMVPLQEVVVRAAWAAVRSWGPANVLRFLLDVDRLLGGPPA
jgi:hypothetical protein